MKEQEDRLAKIDRFVRNKMTKREKADFEKQMWRDRSLSDDVSLHAKLIEMGRMFYTHGKTRNSPNAPIPPST